MMCRRCHESPEACHWNLSSSEDDSGLCEECTPTLCPECQIHRPPPGHSKCAECFPHSDVDKKCYNCEMCQETRRYLKEEGNFLTIISTKYSGLEVVEICRCSKCSLEISIYCMPKSTVRDVLQEKMRKDHEKVCDSWRLAWDPYPYFPLEEPQGIDDEAREKLRFREAHIQNGGRILSH